MTGTPAAAADPAAAAPIAHRGRLFRKYLLLIISLVSVTLLVSRGIGLYFSYQENRAASASLQREKAIGASSRIEQYLRQISQQLVYAALPQIDASDVELRRIEFLKLLRQAPEVANSPQFARERLRIIALAAQHRLPAMYEWGSQVEDGGLMPCGSRGAWIAERVAGYVDRIFKGAKPADLPVEQPTKFELVINMKTAKALGITVPQSLLLRADEVIQ